MGTFEGFCQVSWFLADSLTACIPAFLAYSFWFLCWEGSWILQLGLSFTLSLRKVTLLRSSWSTLLQEERGKRPIDFPPRQITKESTGSYTSVCRVPWEFITWYWCPGSNPAKIYPIWICKDSQSVGWWMGVVPNESQRLQSGGC